MAALTSLDLIVNRGDLFRLYRLQRRRKNPLPCAFWPPSLLLPRHCQNSRARCVTDADAVRHVIGYMPDFSALKDMEVTEYLDFFGACYKIPTAQRERTVNDVLELVGLTEKRCAIIGALSADCNSGWASRACSYHDRSAPARRTGERARSSRA